MLTLRHAPAEMRAPIRTWLHRNAGTVTGIGVATLAMSAATTLAVDCEPMPTGWFDCPVAAEGALVMHLSSDMAPASPAPQAPQP